MPNLTIKDIARISGCSVSTISRVINDRPDVRPETKEHVLKVMREAGFVPNTNARQLKIQQSRSVVFVVKGTRNLFFASSTAAGVSGACPVQQVYYLNFKPEQDQDWQDLAAEYTKETGVPVTVVTAASGQYETTLMSEMEKSEAPTLFQVNGPVGLANWKDYCLDLSDSKLYGELTQ